ncbi:NAD-dependent epimerase/dehydratase family protein [Jiangella asiatica]|uniref:NAD-dependent epimerase/dehydratase family protein n=1 Tax=Jiangella asiatica TaxID=2530372 RepID=A0A4R5CUP8_9ACTN|nr:NAD-dependent epimerase/dehydratase family protein [Jiangella asiatica]TDE01483.1 NAD-dependent epimerase/dehydratase family protein [Jiangella asiatica]
MHIVVTGATGNLGTSAVTALTSDNDVEVTGIARRRPAWRPPRTEFVEADVRSPRLAEHLSGADAVVHLAWAFQPTHDPLATWDVNVRGGIATFEAAAAAGARTLVYVSSVGAYSPGAGRRVDETWPTHSIPTVAYGREKAYLERFLDAFELRHSDIRVVRLRPSFAFQRASASSQGRIFAGPLLPRRLVRPGRLPLLAVPAGLRFQAVHADDVGAAVRLAVRATASGAFNLATDDVIDAAGLGEVFQARTVTVPPGVARAVVGAGWRLRLVPADEQLLSLLLSLPTLDSGRARRELGWRPAFTGREALTELLTGLADGEGGPTRPLRPGR